MKKLFLILLALALTLTLLAGCGAAAQPATPAPAADPAPAETSAPAAEAASVAMTDSYREGRQAYYDVTGVWMPEAEGFEAEYEVNYEQKSICFDSQGDRALFEAAKAVLLAEFGAPSYEDEISANWEIEQPDGGSVHYEIYYHDADPNDVWVFMNVY